MPLIDQVKHYTASLEEKGLLRSRQISRLDELDELRFDSNDYLSLSKNPKIAKAYQEGFKSYPSGSSSSMLLSGYHENHRLVEQAFADFLQVDDCLLFSSGYCANLAVAALLGQLNLNCFIDKGVHASIYDGLNQAKMTYTRFKHNDMTDLATKIELNSSASVVLCEGIYSMSGQCAPLSTMASLIKRSETALFVDEAHSFGLLGHQGRGAVDAYQLTQNEVPIRAIGLGKVFAFQGALVAGQRDWIQALLQAGRSLIYSTAISPALCQGILTTLDVIKEADDRRLKLRELIHQFKECVADSAFQWTDSSTGIQQLQLGCSKLALYYAQELKKKGIYCSCIRPPTVSEKATGLRIILNYRHEAHQIKRLFNELHKIDEH